MLHILTLFYDKFLENVILLLHLHVFSLIKNKFYIITRLIKYYSISYVLFNYQLFLSIIWCNVNLEGHNKNG